VLGCVELGCAVLCCVELCCAVLCCVVLCCIGLCCVALCCIVLCCVVLHCAALCWVVLCCVALCWTLLGCVLLHLLCCVGLSNKACYFMLPGSVFRVEAFKRETFFSMHFPRPMFHFVILKACNTLRNCHLKKPVEQIVAYDDKEIW
jgi:hypothetical protein